MAATIQSQLRVLTLNKGQNKEAVIFRLEKGWRLHFVLGPSLADQDVRVFVNHPESAKSGSDRNNYRELAWENYSQQKSDVYDNYAEVGLVLAGSFNYYFTIDGSNNKKNANGKGHFLVDPAVKAGQYDEKIPLDCITCQTVISKLLGPFDEWKGRLQVAKESGYNMIHFTPLQELGASNSAYALSDQLKLNPDFNSGSTTYTFREVDELVQYMRKEWGILSLTDLVYNHTANESLWIQEHPECVYNVVNAPHLKPPYLLDRILWHFTLEVADGKWEEKGIPKKVRTWDHLKAIQWHLENDIIKKHKLHEFFLLHIDDTIEQFRTAIKSGTKGNHRGGGSGAKLVVIPDPKFRRLKAVIDMPLALHLYNVPRSDAGDEADRVNKCCAALRTRLDELNAEKYQELQSHLAAAVKNFIANVNWRFVDPNGDKVDAVTEKEPLMYNYFLIPKERTSLEREEELMHTEWGNYCMAHNGWVMGDDPLRNFAEPGSNVYLRRELIPWGDSVKLRYGSRPADCPFLWEHMRQYTVLTATIFDGVRLDNCHSTPIHVAEWMLDEARKVRPDLYVIAELFTSSEHTDNLFINRLGLTSLIRESLNAGNSHELGRLVHRYGGFPVGAFIQPPARPLVPTMAHAIFLDQTHDNPSPVERRTALDLLPSTALVAMACCASGSNRGYDELVPHHIHVVNEKRLYRSWNDSPKGGGNESVCSKTGIMAAKKALNILHQELGAAGFTQVYVDQVDQDIVSVTRHNQVSHQSVILVARTVFHEPPNMNTGFVPPLCVPGLIDEIILEGRVVHKTGAQPFKKDATFVNGLPGYHLHLREHIKVYESDMVELRDIDDKHIQEVDFVNFPPGSVIAFKVSLNSPTKTAILAIRQCLSQFGYRVHTYSGRNLQEICNSDIEQITSRLTLHDLNRALYRCDSEEKDDGKGSGSYHIPGFGTLPYCGLQGVMSLLSKIRPNNDLGHPLCENLRNGDWLAGYMANRLKLFPGTRELGLWFEGIFKHLSLVPRYLIPCYFDAIVTGVYILVEEIAWAKMAPFVTNGSSFVRALAMGSLQFCSYVRTAPLPQLSPHLSPPAPPCCVSDGGSKEQTCLTLAAGMPHFSSGIFRNWGRDTFISLRGLLILTGRYDEARYIILAYAGCLRHGLIPNLLGSGAFARFNCRDSVWWWLQCIQDYCKMVPNGTQILNDVVSRLYPTDDAMPEAPGIADQPLHVVIQEALQKHAEGLKFRERNAGKSIDNDMSDQGFNNEIGVHWNTGFVFGGNVHNCGTWMDKMGSSEKAGNKGKPATPRDGSAIELVGLCKSAVRWLAEMNRQGVYPYDGVDKVVDGKKVHVTFAEWNKLIQDNFENHFWVREAEPDCAQESRPDLINKRGIIKDTLGASQPWTDYQLRPNFPVTMVVAPELFTPANAWVALSMVQKHLLGPLGMKTLDPSDWAYEGNYINSDDSHDAKKARGFNYHQGPEWVWPLGFFLRAKLYFAQALEKSRQGITEETIRFIKSVLSAHNIYVHKSDWKSLPELTNMNGAVCGDSCEAQAWSVACLLEALYDMESSVVPNS